MVGRRAYGDVDMRLLIRGALALCAFSPAPAAAAVLEPGLGLEPTMSGGNMQVATRGDWLVVGYPHPVSYTHLDVYKRQRQ